MSLGELVIGRAYVLRGLSADPREEKTSKLPPRIGKLVSFTPGGVPFVKLRMGTFKKWAPRGRRVELEHIEREATPRELLLGFVVEPFRGAVAS